MRADRGPWIDLHGHAGRCFLAGLLRDRGLPASHVGQILGGNAAELLSLGLD